MDGQTAFSTLTPDMVLELVENSLGIQCSNLCRPCNSYINRVYELFDEQERGLIAKFYRPGRWSSKALQEEHTFLLELAEAEIPVIAPLAFKNGETLARFGDISFAVFPKKGGRALDEFTDEQWLILGRLLARAHQVGAQRGTRKRKHMHPEKTTADQLAFLQQSGLIPAELLSAYSRVVEEIIKEVRPLFDRSECIRIHGDCHVGNIIYRPGESFYLIDFDDMVLGPPVQDMWMLLPGRLAEAGAELELLLEGYETFRSFDRHSLQLIEPLRAMRYVHYSAWCGHQLLEDGLAPVVPNFGTYGYWQAEIQDLEEQLQRIRGQEPKPQVMEEDPF